MCRDAGVISEEDLSGMNYDDIRNTLITTVANTLGLSVSSLQAKNDAELVSTALLKLDIIRGICRTYLFNKLQVRPVVWRCSSVVYINILNIHI